jgi:hypothetical protein
LQRYYFFLNEGEYFFPITDDGLPEEWYVYVY